MFDIKMIRDNPQAFDAQMARRGLESVSTGLLDIDAKLRDTITRANDLQNRRNTASKEIGMAMRNGDAARADALKAEVSGAKEELANLEDAQRNLEAALTDALSRLPNIMFDDVPEGADEADNELIRTIGEPTEFDFEAKEHWELGEQLGEMDFERAAKLSGSRFVTLKAGLARLSRALGQFMLDLHTEEHGYEETIAPVLVRDGALFGTSQLPKFADDLFKTDTGHYLIPTSEVSLTNQRSGEILSADELPLRMTALSSCFRSEAGAAGRDTRGMIRQHQFEKVELVSVVTPEEGEAELERKTAAAEEVLKRLALPYRVMKLCSGDIGFSAHRTYDLEVWLPGQGQYREISSCSLCGDFQARRMNMRYRPAGEKKTRFPHTLNGSGLAVGRTLIAVMENYQQADGSIRVPNVLKPYMGGLDVIGAS